MIIDEYETALASRKAWSTPSFLAAYAHARAFEYEADGNATRCMEWEQRYWQAVSEESSDA